VIADEGIPEIEPTAQLLILASARLNRLHGKALGQLAVPLTYRQHRILMRVSEGHTSLAAIAAFGNLTLPTVSESVDGLVRRGLLTRKTRRGDRRALRLGLTALGRSACVAGQRALGEVTETLIRDLSQEQRDLLHTSLTTIFDAATTYFQAELSGTSGGGAPAEGFPRSVQSMELTDSPHAPQPTESTENRKM
jgi:DNA-binding MarR family transcriptional regulator